MKTQNYPKQKFLNCILSTVFSSPFSLNLKIWGFLFLFLNSYYDSLNCSIKNVQGFPFIASDVSDGMISIVRETGRKDGNKK